MARRADFLAANRGLRAPMPGFVLLVHDRRDGDPTPRLGITVTKKIGGAVIRNRMKRRFRALARQLLPTGAIAGADHVLIGRAGGVERDYGLLATELEKALRKLAAKSQASGSDGSQELRSDSREARSRGTDRPSRSHLATEELSAKSESRGLHPTDQDELKSLDSNRGNPRDAGAPTGSLARAPVSADPSLSENRVTLRPELDQGEERKPATLDSNQPPQPDRAASGSLTTDKSDDPPVQRAESLEDSPPQRR